MLKRRCIDRKGSKSERSSRPKNKKPPQRPDKMESETEYTSSAAKKLAGQLHEVSFDPTFSYCILQFTAVFTVISECVVCRTCGGNVKFLKASTRGLGFKLNIFCTTCDDNIQCFFISFDKLCIPDKSTLHIRLPTVRKRIEGNAAFLWCHGFSIMYCTNNL